jgi:hypothetical protein
MAARARRARRGRTKPQQVLPPARCAGSTCTVLARRQCRRRRAGPARETQIQFPGVLASSGAIATPDTGSRQATTRVFSVILATTTTRWIGTSAPSAGGGSSPRPQVRQPPKRASRAPLAFFRMRAVRTAMYALQIRIHLKRQISSPIAPAMLEQQGPTEQPACYARRGSTR